MSDSFTLGGDVSSFGLLILAFFLLIYCHILAEVKHSNTFAGVCLFSNKFTPSLTSRHLF